MIKAAIPYIAKIIVSSQLLLAKRWLYECARKCLKRGHKVTVFVRINDPYSYVLLQILSQLQQRFNIEYEFRTILNLQQSMYPAPQMWEKNAFNDAVYLADLYQLDFPTQQPAVFCFNKRQLTSQLLHWELQPNYLDNALALFQAYWHNDQAALKNLMSDVIADNTHCYTHHLKANERCLKAKGHYLTAMLHYAGEWYWGLDRLQYFERRLNDLGLATQGNNDVVYNLAQRDFCCQMSTAKIASARENQQSDNSDKKAIVMYWSARSPYSFLALMRIQKLCRYYDVPLIIKPVLPMLMRRMKVPTAKGSYLLLDVAREARQCQIEFGFIADPLGKGVENCYALYDYAQSKGLANEYLDSFSRAVWQEGIAADKDQGMKQISQRAGLDWAEAKDLLHDDSWRVWAQNNLLELYNMGLWGVPSFKYGDLCVFGQDRIDCIEKVIVSELEATIKL